MARYLVSRILWTIPVLLFAILLTFLLIHAIPGDPLAHLSQKQTVAQTVALHHEYGLDKPIWEQYVLYVWHIVHGNFGQSYVTRTQTVGAQMLSAFPASLRLASSAFLIALCIGIPLGIASALRANGVTDYVITTLSTLLFAVPTFVTGTLWYFFFPFQSGWDTWEERIGPIVILSAALVAYFVRLLRASMIETLQQEYVTTARSKGLPWRVRVFRHVLRNSMGPVITNSGPLLGFTIVGALITEKIFGVPGVAHLYVNSVLTKDYALVLGTTVVLTAMIIVLNLLVDILIAFLDPRISHD